MGIKKLPINIIIADGMMPIREYLRMVLGREADIKIIDTVGTGVEAVNRVLSAYPDVLLMDLDMIIPRTGVSAIKTITSLAPDIHLIVLTLFSDDDNILTAFENGACDYIIKNSSAAEILEAIRMAANEKSPLRLQIARMIRNECRTLRSEGNALTATLYTLFHLSPKELNILRLLSVGRNEDEIAGLQKVGSLLIETYIENILKKFGEPSVDDIVNRLRRLGITRIFNTERLGRTDESARL